MPPKEKTMIVEVLKTINGSREAIWAALTNIKDAAKIIRGIDEIEIVEQPTTGLVGLKWRETRPFFGKPSTVEKVITEAAENEFYKTKAEFDGCVYLSTNRLTQSDRGTILTNIHQSRPQGIIGKILLPLMGIFFKGMAKNALLQDLLDINAEVEQKGRNPA